MSYKKRILLLIWVMTGISSIVTTFTVFSLYRAAFEEEKRRLVETVQSQARIIETMAEFDALYSKSHEPGGPRGATLFKIGAAHNKYEQTRPTMEFTLAERIGNTISFLIRHRHGGFEEYLKPIDFDSGNAVPMRQALLGKSGTIVAEDYRGQLVLAAFEPVAQLNIGVVAKVDLSEIRKPFIIAGFISSLFAICFIGIGATLFIRIGNPLIETIHQQNVDLLEMNNKLELEIKRREITQKALKKSHQKLEEKVKQRTEELSIRNELLEKEALDRKAAELNLKKNERLLKRIFDGISDPLILLDKNMAVLMMNRASVNYYGIENPQEVVGKICHRELLKNEEVCPECKVMQAVDINEQIIYERKGIIDSDRTEKVVVYPIVEDCGSVSSIIIRISDITEKKKFERQIIQKEKLESLGIMVSSIAHEINNPNSFISFNIPILKDYINAMLPIVSAYAYDKPEFELCNLPYREFEKDIIKLISNIENGSKRINQFVSNLREYIHEKAEATRIPVALSYTIDSVISICQSKISNSVKGFYKNIPDSLPILRTHPYSIEQILINFLINACHAADKEDSWIKMEISVDGDDRKQVNIAVSDNGRGIDETALSKIFDPFYSTKSPEVGTGLGLFVSHTLANRMGGNIDVESRLGEGSKFWLRLPISD